MGSEEKEDREVDEKGSRGSSKRRRNVRLKVT
jgi:hypothetical protein